MHKTSYNEKLIGCHDERAQTALKQADALNEALVNLRYEGKASYGKNVKALEKVLEYFETDIQRDMQCHEKVVFPFLETHVPKLIPVIEIFRTEHESFRRSVHGLNFALWVFMNQSTEAKSPRLIEEIWETGHYLLHLIRERVAPNLGMLGRVIKEQLRDDERNNLIQKIRSADVTADRKQ